MIIECPKCKTKYKISEEKLASRGGPIKVKCKKCGTIIEVGPPKQSDRQWYFADKGERKGPFDDDQMLQMLQNGEIEGNTFVWTKGFENWQPAGSVDLFKSVLGTPEDDNEETQLLDSNEIQKLTGEFNLEQEKEGSKDGGDGFVWQRHETSVLFSLDDYQPGMRTISKGHAVVDLGQEDVVPDVVTEMPPEAPGGESQPAVPDVGVISLDEQDVANVKKVLVTSKKRRVVWYVLGGGIVVIGAVVAFVFMNGGGKAAQKTKQESAKAVKTVASTPKKVKKPKQAKPVKTPKPKPKKQVAVASKVTPDAVIHKDAGAKAPKTATKTAEGIRKVQHINKKHRVATETHKKRHARISGKKERKHETRKVAVRKKQPSGGESAQSILNSLRAGKKRPNQAQGAADNSNLPQRLPILLVNRVMKRAKPRVKKCLQKAGAVNEGQLIIMSHLTITGQGYVQRVRLSGPVGAARSCVVGVLKALHFSRFRASTMSITYPYVF